MINLEELQLKFKNNLLELKNIISRIDEELNSQKNYFLQAKEIEKTIQKLEKSGVSVPDELIKLKTDLVSKNAYFEELKNFKTEIQNKILEIVSFENMQRKNRTTNINSKRNLIYSFTFLGENYPVLSWKEFLIKFIKILGTMHPDFAEKAIKIKGKKRPYFTKDKNLLRAPVYIDEISLYIETHFSSEGILKVVYNLLDTFGYEKQNLEVETNDI